MNKKYVIGFIGIFVVLSGLYAMQRPREGVVAASQAGSAAARSYSIADYIAEHGQPQIVSGSLDLSNKGLTSLYGLDQIQGIAQVRRLNLSNNGLNSVPDGIFPAGLQELYLAHNNINTVFAGMFPAGLRELVLSHNRINMLSHGVFPAGLQELNLSHNNIAGSEEDLDAFAQLNNTTLYLLGNPITQVMTQQQFQNIFANVQVGSW